jgi:hypothetical protein
MNIDLEKKITKFVSEVFKGREQKLRNYLEIFLLTTGHKPEDLCLVEQRLLEGKEYKVMYYFDTKENIQNGLKASSRIS